MRVEESASYDKNRTLAYLGDEMGFIKVWDITNLISALGIKKCESDVSKKVSFNPKRKFDIDASNLVNSMYSSAMKIKLPKAYDPSDLLVVKEWRAHKYNTLSISLI
jgi:hypothetical protein